MGEEGRTGPSKPPPMVISRSFKAPRESVFEAWSSAEHMKHWFCPEGFTVPEAEIEFRPGGKSNICMRSPDGQDFWSYGEYIEIVPPERLVFRSSMEMGGERKFMAHTTVAFEPEGPHTKLTVTQAYEVYDPAFMAAVEGAPEGWRTTLDRLDAELVRLAG